MFPHIGHPSVFPRFGFSRLISGLQGGPAREKMAIPGIYDLDSEKEMARGLAGIRDKK